MKRKDENRKNADQDETKQKIQNNSKNLNVDYTIFQAENNKQNFNNYSVLVTFSFVVTYMYK